jgi:hypothetical protein
VWAWFAGANQVKMSFKKGTSESAHRASLLLKQRDRQREEIEAYKAMVCVGWASLRAEDELGQTM